mmetsp:Transcript_5123/g.18114  ORF Transcript_5123/g.18114 Transcript_5123/m.18114 type:complete len:329 (-) Transcript_5123:425-1411(-)
MRTNLFTVLLKFRWKPTVSQGFLGPFPLGVSFGPESALSWPEIMPASMVKIPPTKNQPGAPFLPLALPAFAVFFAAVAFFEDTAFPFEERADALEEVFEDGAFSFAGTGFDVPTFAVAVVFFESKDGLGVDVIDFAELEDLLVGLAMFSLLGKALTSGLTELLFALFFSCAAATLSLLSCSRSSAALAFSSSAFFLAALASSAFLLVDVSSSACFLAAFASSARFLAACVSSACFLAAFASSAFFLATVAFSSLSEATTGGAVLDADCSRVFGAGLSCFLDAFAGSSSFAFATLAFLALGAFSDLSSPANDSMEIPPDLASKSSYSPA